MKKILIFSLVMLLGLVTHAQDTTHIQPDLGSFDASASPVLTEVAGDWTIVEDSVNADENWEKTNYLMVRSDENYTQEQWLISKALITFDDLDATLGEDTTQNLYFDYYYTASDAGATMDVYLSLDGTYDVTDLSALVTLGSYTLNGAPNSWSNENINLDGVVNPGKNTNAKLIFVYETTAANLGVDLIIDNVSTDTTTTINGTDDVYVEGFETGMAAASWTTENVAGADENWDNYYHVRIDDDINYNQQTWLTSPSVYLPKVAYTTYTVQYSYYITSNTAANEGVRLALITALDTVYGADLRNSNGIQVDQVLNINAYADSTVSFALVFNSLDVNAEDFYLTDLVVSQDFDETSVAADAKFTGQNYDAMVYPAGVKYDNDSTDLNFVKEGFWALPPMDWTLSSTADTSWVRNSTQGNPANHDYHAYVSGKDLDNEQPINESLISETIEIDYPSVGADYVLSFEWATETDLNCGTNTNPDFIGAAGSYSDFADAYIQISIDGGAYFTIWEDDNEDDLNEYTNQNATAYTHAWTDYQDYLDNPGNWYQANINLSEITTIDASTTSIAVQFVYDGDGVYSGYFALDNFYIMQTQLPDYEFYAAQPFTVEKTSASFNLEYGKIPVSQIENPYAPGAILINNGVSDATTEEMRAYYNYDVSVDGTYDLNGGTDVLVGSVEFVENAIDEDYLEVEDFLSDSLSFELGSNGENVKYRLSYSFPSGNITGAPNGVSLTDKTEFTVTETVFAKHDGATTSGTYVAGESQGIGTLLEFKNSDIITSIDVWLSNAGEDFNLKILKVSGPWATAVDEVVYTSPIIASVAGKNTINFKEIELGTGYYIFMFNQLSNNSLGVVLDDEGTVYRRDIDGNIYWDAVSDDGTVEDEGDIKMDLNIKPNTAPAIATETMNAYNGKTLTVLDGNEFILELVGEDADGDSLDWVFDGVPTWLTGWVSTVDSSNNNGYLIGTPTVDDLGTSTFTISLFDENGAAATNNSLSLTIRVISQEGLFEPTYTESFSGGQPANWFTIDDKDNVGSDEHWVYSGNQMMIEGDNNDEQNEWLVSPPIVVPTLEANSDTTFTMEFDWSVDNFDYFCGGITGILGTGSSGSFNLADVMLLVSTNRGQTWADTLWQEDNIEKVSSSTDGIEGGEDWGYSDNTTYTSVFDVTDAYGGDTIMVAMVYKGKNANWLENRFYFDNFKINLNEPEVNISVYAEANYDGIPLAQVDYENGESFMAYFVNEGDFVPEGATYTWQILETEGYGEVNIPVDFFNSSDTVAVEFNYVPEFGYTGNIEYSISLDAENNTSTNVSDNFNTNFNATQLYPELLQTSSASTDGLSVGLGSIFEVKRTDRLRSIRTYIDAATNGGTDYAISIIKINNGVATSGTVVYTIDDSFGSPLDVNPNSWEDTYVFQDDDYDDVILTPGLYVIMYKQLEAGNPIVIGKSNNPFGDFVRGFAGNIYREAEDEGYLNIQMRFYSNNAPDFVSTNGTAIQELTVDVIEGFEKVVDLYGMDDDEEALSFGQIVEPAYLDHSWLSVVDNGNDTATMTIDATAVAGEHFAKMYVTDGFDTTELELTINVHEPMILADEFDENFNAAPTENYPDYTVDEHWTLYSGTGRESTNDWYDDGSYGRINADANNYQDEWLISDNYYIPVTGGDTLYQFSFRWYLYEFDNMIGGTYGVIGSGNEFDDFNYADLRVKVSTDNGNTWTLLWQEDNEALVEASTDLNYPWDDDVWYTSEFDMSDYEGQAVKIAFQYEGMDGSTVQIDDIMLERVDPYEELDIVNYDVLPMYVPRKQAKNIDIKFSIENTGTATTKNTTIAAQVLKNGNDLNPAYEETMDIGPLSKGEVVEYQFPMVSTELLESWDNTETYAFNFDIYQPYTQNSSHTTYITDEYYAFGNTNNGSITSEPNKGLGQVFYFAESDLLTQVYVYSDETNYLTVDLVKLDSADATDGELVYSSSPVQKDQVWGDYLDIEDVEVDSGYYAVFINDSEVGETFRISYDTESGDNPGTYIKGTADGFEVVEEDAYLYFRLYFDNTAPYFANSTGVSAALQDEDAYVGVPFTKTVRAKDDDEDDVAGFMGETLPTWVTVTDNGDGFATITGTPTVNDMGENLVVLRAVDGTTFDEDDFIIDVMANPAPSFITAPITTAYEGKAYSYQAEATDMLGDDVTLTGSGPGWLTLTVNGSSLTVTGTPSSTEIGQHVVKITATDVNGMTKQQVYTLTVYANADPMFTTSPKLKATAGMEYIYRASAMDEDENQTLTIAEGTNFPAWLTLTTTGNGKATISGTPATTDAGNNSVDIVVNDGLGGTATQSFVIDVMANSVPAFTSTAVTAATEDILYEYFITATDADGDYLYFDAMEVANWLTFTVTGNGTATLQGVPTQKDVGSHDIVIHLGDGTNTVAHEFTITVGEVNDAPVFKSTANDVAKLGVEYEYLAEAIDEEGMSLIYNSASLPEWLTIEDQFDGTALIYGVPSESDLGEEEVAIAVTDGENTSEQIFNLSVTNAVGVNGDAASNVSIYPNPTDGEFTITNIEGADVYVFNTAGKVVKQVESASKIQKIDLSVFNAGSYIVKVITNDKVVTKQLNLMK